MSALPDRAWSPWRPGEQAGGKRWRSLPTSGACLTVIACWLGSCADAPPIRLPVLTPVTRVVATFSGPEPLQSGAVLLLPDGRVVIGHRRHFTVLDTVGHLLDRFGREGAGPGEFLFRLQMIRHGDSLLLRDPVAGRQTAVHTGDFGFRSIPLPFLSAPRTREGIRMMAVVGRPASGGYLASALASAGAGLQERAAKILVATPHIDSVGRVLLSDWFGMECMVPNDGRPVIVPACQRPLHLVAPNGESVTAVVHGADLPGGVMLRAVRVAVSGDTIMRTELTLPARRMTAALRDSLMADLVRSSPVPVKTRGYTPPARFGPVLFGHQGDDGSLWLASIGAPAGRRWYLVAADGRLRGEMVLDRELTLGAVSGDGAWAVRDLENGDAELVRITVQPTP